MKVKVIGAGDPAALPPPGGPKLSDQIALAEGAVNNAFSNAYFLAGGRQLSCEFHATMRRGRSED